MNTNKKTNVIYNDDATILGQLEPGSEIETVNRLLDWTTEHLPIGLWAIQSACPDVCYQRTKAGELLGHRLSPEQRGPIERGIDLLLQQGTDLLELYCRNLRPKGIKVLAEIRMSDTHHRSRDWDVAGCPLFSIEHPEYAIPRFDGVPGMALDYSHPEVREHRLAIMREFATERDIDGLELNFMRWAKHFERDWGYEKAPIMTDFVRQIRGMLDEAGAARGVGRLLLGARVPSTLNECFMAGCDVADWMRQGWIDYIVPSEHNSTWLGLNVEQFVAARGESECSVYAMMGDMIGGMFNIAQRPGTPDVEDRGLARFPGRRGYGSMLNTQEEARAAAHNFFTWGTEGIGLWNIPNNCNYGYGLWGSDPRQVQRMLDWIREAIDPVYARSGTRRYHYVPLYKYSLTEPRNYKYIEAWRSPHGEFKAPTIYFNRGTIGRRQVYPFRMADGRNGEKLRGTLRFRIVHAHPEDNFEVDINGLSVSTSDLSRTFERDETNLPWTWVTLDLADCPPLRGDNELGIIWEGGFDHELNAPYMEEVDVTVEP